MTHMPCELLAQASGQIITRVTRPWLGFRPPASCDRWILTPPGDAKEERDFPSPVVSQRQCLESEGWHLQDEDFATQAAGKSVVPVPEIQMEWGRGQLRPAGGCITKPFPHFSGQTEAFFRLPRPSGSRLSLASSRVRARGLIDIGGGMIDMAITHYQLDDGSGNNVKITPQLLFREGFKVAGDDLRCWTIQRYVRPPCKPSSEIRHSRCPPADGIPVR